MNMDYFNPAFLTPLGVLVVEVLLLLTGWLVPKWQVQNLIDENAHLRTTVETLTGSVEDFAAAANTQIQTAEIVSRVMTTLQHEAQQKHGGS